MHPNRHEENQSVHSRQQSAFGTMNYPELDSQNGHSEKLRHAAAVPSHPMGEGHLPSAEKVFFAESILKFSHEHRHEVRHPQRELSRRRGTARQQPRPTRMAETGKNRGFPKENGEIRCVGGEFPCVEGQRRWLECQSPGGRLAGSGAGADNGSVRIFHPARHASKNNWRKRQRRVI